MKHMWTPAEDARLKSMVDAGASHAAIAKALGRPYTSIGSRLKTLSMQKKRAPKKTPVEAARSKKSSWPQADVELFDSMLAAGRSVAEIAVVLGRSLSSVAGRFAALKPRGCKTRDCMCCRRPFASEGPHHRLCPTCRNKDFSPYAH